MCIGSRSATFFFSSVLSLHLSSFKLMIARAAALNTTRCSMFVFFVLFLHLFFLQHSSFVCHRDKNGQMTTEIECSTWMTLEFNLIYFMREIETFERLKRKKRKRKRNHDTIQFDGSNGEKNLSDFPFLHIMKRWIGSIHSKRAAWQNQAINCHHWYCQVAMASVSVRFWCYAPVKSVSALKSPRFK